MVRRVLLPVGAGVGGVVSMIVSGAVGLAVALWPLQFAFFFTQDPQVASTAARGLITKLRALTLETVRETLDLGEDPTGLAPLLQDAELRAILDRLGVP